MTINQGDDTADFVALHQPHPAEPDGSTVAEAEVANQRMGCRLAAVGLSLMILPTVGVLAWLVIDRASMNDNGTEVLAMSAYVSLTVVGAMFAGVSFFERLQRYPRAMLRRAMTRDLERAEQIDRMTATAAQASGRLAAVERALLDVPGYGQGVIDGVQLRAEALGPEVS